MVKARASSAEAVPWSQMPVSLRSRAHFSRFPGGLRRSSSADEAEEIGYGHRGAAEGSDHAYHLRQAFPLGAR